MWMMPEITLRSSTRRAPGWFFGRWGSIARHASSDSQNNERDISNSLLLQWRLPESMYTPIFKRLIEFGPYPFGCVHHLRGNVARFAAYVETAADYRLSGNAIPEYRVVVVHFLPRSCLAAT